MKENNLVSDAPKFLGRTFVFLKDLRTRTHGYYQLPAVGMRSYLWCTVIFAPLDLQIGNIFGCMGDKSHSSVHSAHA